MAWKARLAQPIISAGDHIAATFEFFDDADPSEVLFVEGFQFPASWSNQDMVDTVQGRGRTLRATRARAAVLAANFPPVTTVINIP